MSDQNDAVVPEAICMDVDGTRNRNAWTKPNLTEVAVADVTFSGGRGTNDCSILT